MPKPKARINVTPINDQWHINVEVDDATDFIDVQAIINIDNPSEARFWSYTNALTWDPFFITEPVPPTNVYGVGSVPIDPFQYGETVVFRVYHTGIRKALVGVHVELPPQ